MVRAILADDHKMFVECLAVVLRKEVVDLVDVASDGLEALEKVRLHKPQLVILDLSMPKMNGMEVAQEILREFPVCRILVLTADTSEETVTEALRVGIHGYLLKSEAITEIPLAIRKLMNGEFYVSSHIVGALVRQLKNRQRDNVETLSLRERQVLQLIAEGYSTKEVAGMLAISTKTAESHRSRLMDKLGIHETASLVRYAIRRGFVKA